MYRVPVTYAGEIPGSNSEGECFRVRFRQRRRADSVSLRIAPGELTLQTNLVYLVRLVCLVFWLNETSQMNQINQINKTNQKDQANQTNQINKITIFGYGLTSFYWELFHELIGKERGLEHPTHAG